MPYDPTLNIVTAYILKSNYTNKKNYFYKADNWTFSDSVSPTWELISDTLAEENISVHQLDAGREFLYYQTFVSTSVVNLYSLDINSGANTLIFDQSDAVALSGFEVTRLLGFCCSVDVPGKLFVVILDYDTYTAKIAMSVNYGSTWSLCSDIPQSVYPDNIFSNAYPFRCIASAGNYIHVIAHKIDSFAGGRIPTLVGSSNNGTTWTVAALPFYIMDDWAGADAINVEVTTQYPDRAIVLSAGWKEVIYDETFAPQYLVHQDGCFVFSLSGGYSSDLSNTFGFSAGAIYTDYYSTFWTSSPQKYYINLGNFDIRKRFGGQFYNSHTYDYEGIGNVNPECYYFKTTGNDAVCQQSQFPFQITCFTSSGTSLAVGTGYGINQYPIIISIPDETDMDTYHSKVGDMSVSSTDTIRGIYIPELADLYTGIKTHAVCFEDLDYEQ